MNEIMENLIRISRHKFVSSDMEASDLFHPATFQIMCHKAVRSTSILSRCYFTLAVTFPLAANQEAVSFTSDSGSVMRWEGPAARR